MKITYPLFTLFAFLLPAVLILSSSSGPVEEPWAQENVSFPMLNMEIRHSLEEHERQTQLLRSGATLSTLEETNSRLWEKTFQRAEDISSRLGSVSIALEASPTAYGIYLEAEKIIRNQTLLYKEIEKAPYAVGQVLSGQIRFVKDLEMTLRLIVGLSASSGLLLEMEKTDRATLFSFALSEVQSLEQQSFLLLYRVRQFLEKLGNTQSTLMYYVNRDKEMVRSILSGLKF
ncbi:hypothetical protein [Planobacterium oryzisoli]|uniref:Uncharacterized protein n=1 Tax=Planobacterium oryzisoli TaxID=2771435 RepID=A0A931EB99_9FLAO|nr:hypothetical protein [Planobacterium oryzisoli]MBF5026949.1 hypothetical protein [Planobacterium oryzisoli]